jgi:iron complex transport system permease protein
VEEKMMYDKTSRRLRFSITLSVLAGLFILLLILNVSMGNVTIPLKDILKAIFTPGEDATYNSIIWKIRLPRMTSAIILGGALALSGFLLQTFFNNPIAGPYVLGISSGAKLVVAIVLVMALGNLERVSSALLILAAFVGSLLSMGFVLLMAKKVPRAAMLIVSGIMIGYICSAITDFVITFADDANIVNLHNWSRGSFSGAAWDDVKVMAIVVLITSVIVFFMAKPIGAYQLGEGYAQNMGVNIKLFRFVIILLSSVLTACVTAYAGPISFVGIAVPHLVKTLLKTSKPILVIPVCFLGGSIFCLGCDLLARTAFSPTELSVSSVTAIFGAPIVIVMMARKKAQG